MAEMEKKRKTKSGAARCGKVDQDTLISALNGRPAGVYRLTITSTIGTAETTKKSTHVIDYYVRDFHRDEEGLIRAQVIDYAGRLLELHDRINVEQAAQCKLICEDIDEYPKLIMKLSMLNAHIRAGNRHYQEEEYYSAEYEYDSALRIDDKNVEANLGKGKTLFKLERFEEARMIFDELSNNPELYIEEHKHLFNEYGINLRRLNMYEKAIESYHRALEVNPFDPHLYYNLAIVYAELEEMENSIKLLKSAIELKQKLVHDAFEEAETLLNSLLRGGRKLSLHRIEMPGFAGKERLH